MKIITISGSARTGSFNTALVDAFAATLPAGTEIDRLDYADVPLYRQDLEADFPAAVTALKDKIKAADGIVISTPEYNRSIPGYLKNFIDWTSRPYGDSAWKGKKMLIMGATGGHVGTSLAQYHLKQIMLYLDAHIPGQPELFIWEANKKFELDESKYGTTGVLIDEDTKAHLAKAAATFVEFIGS